MSDTSGYERVTVVGAAPARPDGSYPVALWDRDAAYQGGEVFIAGPEPVTVPRTPAVAAAIRAGKLREQMTVSEPVNSARGGRKE